MQTRHLSIIIRIVLKVMWTRSMPPSSNSIQNMLLHFIMPMRKVGSDELVCPIDPICSPSCSQPRIRPRPGHTFRQPMRSDTQSGQQKGIPRTCNVVHSSLALEAGAYIASGHYLYALRILRKSFPDNHGLGRRPCTSCIWLSRQGHKG